MVSGCFLLTYAHFESILYIFFRKFYILYLESYSRAPLSTPAYLNFHPTLTNLAIIYLNFLVFLKLAHFSSTNLFLSKFALILVFLLFGLFYLIMFTQALRAHSQPLVVMAVCSLFFVLLLAPLLNSFLLLFFFLELLSVYYYFFFLYVDVSANKISFIKYKNFLLFYLWNSFLTSMLAGASLVFGVYYFGSTEFTTLSLFTPKELFSCIFFFFVAFCWKLGIGGFHFFKFEIYLYLDMVSVIWFSVVSLVVNLFVFFLLILKPCFLVVAMSYSISFLLLLFTLNVFIFFFRLNTLSQFFAVSSLITLLMLISILLV